MQQTSIKDKKKVAKSWTDPLDDPNFDAGQYIDGFFPTEPTSESVSVVRESLKQKQKQVERDIEVLLLDKEGRDIQEVKRLEQMGTEITELYKRITTVSEKVRDAEEAVKVITADIKTLDLGKKNLIQTMIVFRRLDMLVGAVDNLVTAVNTKKYKESAGLFEAVKQILESFKGYSKTNKKLARVRDKYNRIEFEAGQMVITEIEQGFNNLGNLVGDRIVMKEASVLADGLGCKDRIIDVYLERQIKGYRDIFQDGDDISQLENVARRYAWLVRILRVITEEHDRRIFPKDWQMGRRFCIKFCEVTKRMIVEQLRNTEPLNVEVMLAALKETMGFEAQLDRRFESKVASDKKPGSDEMPGFSGQITGAFEPYLMHYVRYEDKSLEGQIAKYRTERDKLNEANRILESSINLINQFKETLDKCVALTRGKILVELAKVFDEKMCKYAKTVLATDGRPNALSSYEHKCVIVNTADYCSTTVKQMEQVIKSKVETPEEYAEKINFEGSYSELLRAASSAVGALVSQSMAAVETGFERKIKIAWSTLRSVGDQSGYVLTIREKFAEAVSVIRPQINNIKYYKVFCDRILREFGIRYTNVIKSIRLINEVGAEQMLLNHQHIQQTILGLPFLAFDNNNNIVILPSYNSNSNIVILNTGTNVTGMDGGSDREGKNEFGLYKKLATKKMNEVYNLIKVLMAPKLPQENLVYQFLLLFPNGPTSLLTTVLEMKGVRSRVEQKVYMDILNDNVKFENKNHFVVSNGMFASKNDKGARNVTSNTVSNTENVDSGDVGGGGNTESNDSPQIGAAVKKSNNPFI